MRISVRKVSVILAVAIGMIGLNSACVINGDGGFFSIVAGPKYEQEFHRVVPLERGGDFILKNVNGAISIETWNKNEVEINAVKSARGRKSYLDRARIEVHPSERSVEVNTVFERRRNLKVKVSYHVMIPEGTNLRYIKSVNGSIRLMGLFADVEAVTTNGGIRLEDDVSGHVSLSSTNGSIKAYGLEGGVQAATTNGSIVLGLRSVADDIHVRTVNGSITLRFDDSMNAELDARTTNGRIHIDFPVTMESIRKTRRSLEGRVGNGGPDISLKTVNGSIKIER